MTEHQPLDDYEPVPDGNLGLTAQTMADAIEALAMSTSTRVPLRTMRWATTSSYSYNWSPEPERYESLWYADLLGEPTPVEPPPPLTLTERFTAAALEADRCAQRGDTLGRVAAIRLANDLRRQILREGRAV